MNIKERLILLKAGYSKKEIEALAEAEIKEAEAVKEELKEVDTTAVDVEEVKEENKGGSLDRYMEVINNLANEVKELKTNIYQNNINKSEIKEVNAQDEAEKILASIVNPFQFNQEDK